MLFDFERFTTGVKLAYRRIGDCAYGLDDILKVFRYYFETYEYITDEVHPALSINQITSIIKKMPTAENGELIIDPEDYELLIDQHFITKYAHCDFNINHFFSGRIREMRYYETQT